MTAPATTKKADALPTRGITPPGTLSYPHLFTAVAGEEGQKPKFSMAIVWSAEDQKHPLFKELKTHILNAAINAFGATAPERLLEGALKNPLRRDVDKKYSPDGSAYFMNFRSDTRPNCVSYEADAEGKPARITAEEQVPGNPHELYPGCRVRASYSLYGFNKAGNKGVGAGLNNVQKLGEGTRIDGRKAAQEEFDVDLSAAPADLTDLM